MYSPATVKRAVLSHPRGILLAWSIPPVDGGVD